MGMLQTGQLHEITLALSSSQVSHDLSGQVQVPASPPEAQAPVEACTSPENGCKLSVSAEKTPKHKLASA